MAATRSPVLGQWPQMPDMIRSWRLRRDPRDLPEIVSLPAHRQRSQILTQALMADLIGCSERQYRRLELGTGPVSRGVVAAAARILALHPAEREALYSWAGHTAPTDPPLAELDESLNQFLDEIPHGAYYSDPSYDIVAYNGLAAVHWPWITEPGANIMTSLLATDGRGRAQCVDWEERWAPPMIAQLRSAGVRAPDDTRLQEVIERVRGCAVIRRIWDGDAEMRSHAYGDVRPMLMPAYGTREPVWIRIVAWTPLHRSDVRLVVGSPVSDVVEPRLPGGVPDPR